MMAEVKEKTLPNMLGVLQKNVKNGHFIGSEVCNQDNYGPKHPSWEIERMQR